MFRDPWHGGEPVRSRELVTIPLDGSPGVLEAALAVPRRARGVAVLVHGSVPSPCCPCDGAVARGLERAGFATLRVDLLTGRESGDEVLSGRYAVAVELFAARLGLVTSWLAASPATRGLPLCYYGAGTGAAAALAAAVARPDRVAAVVSCGGRVDLLSPAMLARVRAAVLLIEGTAEEGPRTCEKDGRVLAICRAAREHLACARLVVVRGATHWFVDPGTFDVVAHLAADWFARHVAPPAGAAGDAHATSSRR